MSFFNSKVSTFHIEDTGATERELTAYITEMSGLPGERALDEVTALGDQGAKSIPGIQNVSFSISGIFDDTATSGPDAVLGPLRDHTSTVTFKYGPKGDTTGFVRYTGECWLTGYDVRSRVGSRVEYSASFQVDGVVTRDTF